jgi:hypothetical protein
MDTIVNYLKDPTVLCKQIGLCGSGKPSKAALVFLKNAPKVQVSLSVRYIIMKSSIIDKVLSKAYLGISIYDKRNSLIVCMRGRDKEITSSLSLSNAAEID